MTDMWSTIAAERGALADDLIGLSTAEWRAASLCSGWSVEDVLAHMTSTAQMTPPRFVVGFAGAGFNFGRFADRGIEAHRGAIPEETLAGFRAQQHSTASPPGPQASWLGETLVHAEDIRRPLGITHTYPADSVRLLLDFYQGSNALIGTKKRIEGVTLKATDTDWAHGSGPVAEGTGLALLMAMTGRQSYLANLSGEGVAVLREQ
jgi:uncharacterized protein (TIGR03083 family)